MENNKASFDRIQKYLIRGVSDEELMKTLRAIEKANLPPSVITNMTQKMMIGITLRQLQRDTEEKRYKRIDENQRKIIESMEQLKQHRGVASESSNKPDTSKQKNFNLQTKPAGRKVDPWNPIAFDIMNDGRENAGQRAFDYWCKEQGLEAITDRDRKAFKQAMKRERGRRGT